VSAAILIPGVALLIGLLFGSFLNVCIARLPADESVVTPRSRCPGCGHDIRWYDNIPLLSYALLRGRCRDCGTTISLRYPAVELATGIWFALSFLPLAGQLSLAMDPLLRVIVHCTADATLGCFLIALLVIDWQHHLLPNALTYPGIFAGLLFACAEAMLLNDDEANVVLKRQININSAGAGRSPGNIFLTGAEHLIFSRLAAAIAAFLVLYLIRATYKALRKRDGMGLGDAKLLALIAAFLGLELTVVALFAGLMLATLYATPLLLRRRANAATRLPFGSFLAMGGIIAASAGEPILNAYFGLFR
jgi:leader peptidase (prepilin peptidase)/N-methyltransferase